MVVKKNKMIMNKRYITLLFLSLLSFCLFSCKKDLNEEQVDSIVVKADANTLTFKKEAGLKTITIDAKGISSWRVVEDFYASWVKASKAGNSLRIQVEENKGSKERSTKVRIAFDKGERTILVVQNGVIPILALDGTRRNLYFKKDFNTVGIKLKSNANDWTVDVQGAPSWIAYEKDFEHQTLYIAIKEFKKTDDNFRTNRKASVYITSGYEHIKLNITQTGWIQFGDPIFFPKGTSRAKVLEEEKKLRHERDESYEMRFYPKGEAGDKEFMGVSNDGEQVGQTVYVFEGDKYDKFNGQIYLRANKGELFDIAIFKEAMAYKGFKLGLNPDPSYKGVPTLTYHKEGGDFTYIYVLYNNKESYIHSWDKGAFIECQLASNNMEVENDKMISFPVRNFSRMDDPTYQWEEVVAYEKDHGMVIDYDSEFTVLNTKVDDYPEVKYVSLAFKPADEKVAAEKPGALLNVVYTFNYPEADESGESRFLSRDPELSGSFGRRYDLYNGRSYSLGYNGAGYDVLRKDVRVLASSRGFQVLRQEFGWCTLWRGEDPSDVTIDKEFIDVTGYSTKTGFDYYRTKISLDRD